MAAPSEVYPELVAPVLAHTEPLEISDTFCHAKMDALIDCSRVVREAAEGRTGSLTIDEVLPTAEQKTLYAKALQHLLERLDWKETDVLDAYLPMDERRQAWMLTVDVSAVASTAHYLDMDAPFLHSLGTDMLRAANTVEGVEAQVRACERATALVDAAFARVVSRVNVVRTKDLIPIDLPRLMPKAVGWGRGVPLPPLFAAAMGIETDEVDEKVNAVAALFGRLPLLRALHAKGRIVWYLVCPAAVSVGRRDIVEWAVAKGYELTFRDTMAAAAHGDLDLLKWMCARGVRLDSFATASAARHGHLHVLQWLQTQGVEMEIVYYHAVEGGHVAVLEWALAEGIPMDRDRHRLCGVAAARGHLAALQWARAQGCPWGDGTAHWAARRGELAVVQWAHANGCSFGALECAHAARHGHLQVLQWLRAQGVPWDRRVINNAARQLHGDVVQWAVANGCPE
jgi:hypothetical protein